jgi:predicted nucleic acid-binding protein
VEEEFAPADSTPRGYVKALELKRRGFRDLVDLLLYATALSRGLLLLTRDAQLLSFLADEREDTSVILLEEEFVRRYAQR